jgi:hypothetical protein
LCLHRHSHPDIGPGDNSPASATPPSQ